MTEFIGGNGRHVTQPMESPEFGSYPVRLSYPLGEGWVLCDSTDGRVWIVNAIAKTVWELLTEGYDEQEIVALFVQQFHLPYGQALKDVTQIVTDLTTDEHLPCPAAGQAATLIDAPHELLDLGSFRFGGNRIQMRFFADEINASYFHRFRHRRLAASEYDEPLETLHDASGYYLRFRGEEAIPAGNTLMELMASVNAFLLHQEHPDIIFLAYFHAGTVSRGGKSLLLPGHSGAGKSTLTAYLCANGFAYLGDDFIAMAENDGSLRALPTCLSLKSGSWPILQKLYPGLLEIPLVNHLGRTVRYLECKQAMVVAPPPSAIVFPCYSASESTQLIPCPSLQAMARLIGSHADLARPITDMKLAKFIGFVEKTPAYELHYSDLQSAMETLEHLLETER